MAMHGSNQTKAKKGSDCCNNPMGAAGVTTHFYPIECDKLHG
jgi:hypothetical protein